VFINNLSRFIGLLLSRGKHKHVPRAIFFLNLPEASLDSFHGSPTEKLAQLLNPTIFPSSVKIPGKLFGKRPMNDEGSGYSWYFWLHRLRFGIVSLGRLATDARYVKKSTACTHNIGVTSCVTSADFTSALKKTRDGKE